MKKQGLRIFAYLTVVLMLLSIFSAGALAASDNGQSSDNGMSEKKVQDNDSSDEQSDETEDDNEPSGVQDHDRDHDMVNAPDATRKMAANKVINRVQEVKDTRDGYLEAKNNFASIKSKNPNLNSEEAIEATKTYLTSSIDYMLSFLVNEEYIEELEEERDNVEAATTRAELADSAKNIRNIWNDSRKNRIVTSGKVIDNKISEVVKASDALILRLENEITTMKENGEDAEELEEMLAKYQELMDDAKENQEHARNTYRNGNGSNGENVREANRYIVQAGKDIKDANGLLRNMLKELKEQREGVVVLSGSGELTAEGDGTTVLSGNLSISTISTNATLVIKDMAGNATIDIDEDEYESSNIDNGNSTDNNRAFVYHNVTGDVFIEGSRLTVMIRGDNIELTAEGTGTAVLAGDGTYEVERESGDWASRYVDDDSDDEQDDDSSDNEVDDDSSDNEEDDDSPDDEQDDDSSDDDNEDDSSDENENTV
ncbi:hypothetical protein [Methanolobus sp. ZRKC5]|uniref:hypothetical protein n=1 Tax=unclassified Methanolobus TaxID=2629569 RepID=UPI00313E3F63